MSGKVTLLGFDLVNVYISSNWPVTRQNIRQRSTRTSPTTSFSSHHWPLLTAATVLSILFLSKRQKPICFLYLPRCCPFVLLSIPVCASTSIRDASTYNDQYGQTLSSVVVFLYDDEWGHLGHIECKAEKTDRLHFCQFVFFYHCHFLRCCIEMVTSGAISTLLT